MDFAELEEVQSHLMGVVASQYSKMMPDQPSPDDAYNLLGRAEIVMDWRYALWFNNTPTIAKRGAYLRAPLL